MYVDESNENLWKCEKKLRSYCVQLQAQQQVFSMVFLTLLKNEAAVPNVFALNSPVKSVFLWLACVTAKIFLHVTFLTHLQILLAQ